MEIEKKFILSPSSLSNFSKDCERCWWLTKNTDWARPEYRFPGITYRMDKVLKDFSDELRKSKTLPPDILKNPKYSHLKPFPYQDKVKEYRRERWRKTKIDEGGLAYKDENLQSILHGGLDDLFMNPTNKKVVVLDYKTRGKPPDESIIERSRLQINTYTFLLQQLGHKTEDYGLLMYYWPKEINEQSGDFEFNSEIKEINIDIDLVLSTWKDAIHVINSPSCPTTTCEWCEYFPQP